MNPYPLGLLLTGRRVLVVGGGAVATRRIPALLDAGAAVVVVSPELTPALRDLATKERLTWLGRRFEPSDVDGSWLVQVAVDDPGAAAAVSEAAASRRVFCVRADDRHAATAWTPATARHGTVTVGVTAGGDHRRAMAVRDAIDAMLSEQPHGQGPVEVAGADAGRGRVVLVGGGPGDPELITVRGRRLLATADVVVVDRLAPGLLLDELRPEVEVIDASKIPYGPARTQEEINRLLIRHGRDGKLVVRLKGGDPFVLGRGGEELLACAQAGLPVSVVPGVTSAFAVPAAAHIPVTHRGVAQDVTVVSGHLAPGDPESGVDWSAIGRGRGTVCVLMGLKNLAAIARALVEHGRSPDTEVAVIQDGTMATQRTVRATLTTVADQVAAAGIVSPAVVVVGPVVGVIPIHAHHDDAGHRGLGTG